MTRILLAILVLRLLVLPAFADEEVCKDSREDCPQAIDFFAKIQDAIRRDDRETVASMVRYPLRVRLNGRGAILRTKRQLLQVYDKVFDPAMRSSIVGAKKSEVWGNWQGFTIFQGEIWWEASGDTNSFKLITVNNGGNDFRCPENYATDAERQAAVKAFAENFAKQHPQATVYDLLAERYRLLVAHDCQKTLANIAQDRKPEKAALQIVSPHAQSLTLAGRKFTLVDEYYDATTRVWSIIFVDDPQHPESFANRLIFNFYDWTPKPTAEEVAMALSEERPGTKNIFVFKAPDEPRGEMVYHIVSVTRGPANFVNLMRVAGWGKSAVNISFGHRLGAAVDLDKTEAEAAQWLLSAEGRALRDAVAALRLDIGWREYLKQVK